MTTITNRPANWACPVTDTSMAKASCDAIDKLNDYGSDGKVSSGINADLMRINAHDQKVEGVQTRAAKAGLTVPSLENSAVISVDTTAWVRAPGNQKVSAELTSPGTWWAKAKDAYKGHSEADVLKALAQAKRNAAEFARNIYSNADGQLADSATGERMEIRIVPTAVDEAKVPGGLVGLVTAGRLLSSTEDDNLTKTPRGVDIAINSETLRVPTVEELTQQWAKGMQYDDPKMRMAWSFLNPGGPIRSALGGAAKSLVRSLRDSQSTLGQDPAKASPEAEAQTKQKLLEVAKSQTVARAPQKGQSRLASTEQASLEKTINSMSKRELSKFIAAWLKRAEDPAAQDDALSAAAQITRNVMIKSKAEATGAKYSISVANGHDIDVVAQVAAKGNGVRFTHLIDAPVNTVNLDVESKAQGSKVAVAVSTPDSIRIFAQVGGLLNENKVLGTGTMQEALNEIGRARNAARAAALAKVNKK